jgi:hypothetical protein
VSSGKKVARNVGIEVIIGSGNRERSTRTFERIVTIKGDAIGMCNLLCFLWGNMRLVRSRVARCLVVFEEVQPTDLRLMSKDEHRILKTHFGA